MSPTVDVHGTVDPAFSSVADAFAANAADHGERGAAVHVIVDGRPVVDLWGGTTDAAGTRPWGPDTLVGVYSAGKGPVAVSLLRLVDRGVVDLDDPVARHWPAFAAHGKEVFTIREALSHRAAVPALRRPVADAELADFDRMAAHVAATEPWWAPGERHAYHTNTFGHLVGGIVRSVTGELPGDALASVAGPADADIFFGVPDDDLARCAEVIWDGGTLAASFEELDALEGDERMTLLGYANPPGYSSMGIVNTLLWRRAQVPSTSGHASARGLARFHDAVPRVLSAAMVAEASTAQSAGWCPTLAQDVTFGLGFQPWTENRPIGRTAGTFGHFGTGGSLGFHDPNARVSFGYVMNHVVPRWRSPRNRALVDAVYDALG